MIEAWKRSELERLTRSHGIRYSKSFGQNFITDRNTLEKIISSADISSDDHIVEIGAGMGALTLFLARTAGRVCAVEIDKRLIPILGEVTEGLPNAEILNEDFLKYDLPSAPYKLIGNLPYYITTPIIAKLFEPTPVIASTPAILSTPVIASEAKQSSARPVPPVLAVLMMQKEVAQRLLSPPGKKTYGAISVLVQYYSEAEYLFDVSREIFVPKPGVDSAVIRLKPRDLSGDDPAVAAKMFRLVRSGFDMRRKTIRNSFMRAGFPEKELITAIKAAGTDPGCRAETLSPRDFYNIASFLL